MITYAQLFFVIVIFLVLVRSPFTVLAPVFTSQAL